MSIATEAIPIEHLVQQSDVDFENAMQALRDDPANMERIEDACLASREAYLLAFPMRERDGELVNLEALAHRTDELVRIISSWITVNPERLVDEVEKNVFRSCILKLSHAKQHESVMLLLSDSFKNSSQQ